MYCAKIIHKLVNVDFNKLVYFVELSQHKFWYFKKTVVIDSQSAVSWFRSTINSSYYKAHNLLINFLWILYKNERIIIRRLQCIEKICCVSAKELCILFIRCWDFPLENSFYNFETKHEMGLWIWLLFAEDHK